MVVTELLWGRHYAMVEPSHFRVDYVINPFMDTAVQPDPERAGAQWRRLASTLRTLGAPVEVIPPRADAPDMVYAMNLGLPVLRHAVPGTPSTRSVVMSHMRYAQRRTETPSARDWFEAALFASSHVGTDGHGPSFEAGDAFAWRGELVVGFGPRTDELALSALAADLDVLVRGVRITHPAMYHLDLAFCPLDEGRALVCPDAFDPASAAMLLDLVPEPLVLTEEEALTTFCANSVVVGRTVVMPSCPDRVRARLEEWGFTVVLVDVTEFHLGGGSVRCLTNPLDLTLGRDLAIVPGGRVVLAEAEDSAA
ncbi:amidinotransferase [Nocardioides sp. GY 10113]|uniref:dimethylarginine dimethylaminohydrolase family protein n=1 Tax=Nocardioides sp. GY 10113 TaxID=2569761 RepID=UPI0010A852BE|nr:arginine deiminase-related protein [Nocardioides sp. GY 10113]TIC84992.1 amidinotransferase [Nocardioides sp. GY 10113]